MIRTASLGCWMLALVALAGDIAAPRGGPSAAVAATGSGDRADAAAPRDASPCTEDAMLIVDASGSMSGTEYQGIGNFVTRMDNVRRALHTVVPEIAPRRKLGLMTYGPGPYNQCTNIALDVPPAHDAGARILAAVDGLVPAGRTPLSRAVELAAEALDVTRRPGVIVLLTDGEETCGGRPCEVAKALAANARQLTVHVIGYRAKDGMGLQGLLESRCLADLNGGEFIAVDSLQTLVNAFRRTLGCPTLTEAGPAAARSIDLVQDGAAEVVKPFQAIAVGE